MPTIHPATAQDIPAMTGLLTLLFTQEAEMAPDSTRQANGLRLILETPALGCLFVAKQNDQVIGMVSLLFSISTARGGPVCWLEDMVVHPDHRSFGAGSMLIQHAINYAESHGYSRITLLTDSSNEKAQKFYRKHGFVDSEMKAMRRMIGE